MFFFQRPSPSTIDRFVSDSRHLELSYRPIGLTRSANPSLHETVTSIGRGQADFARAKQALLDWKQFDLGWVELHPRHSPTATGSNVAVLIKHLGVWSLNGCRVVLHREETSAHFGYAYGTLPTHAESGEELFEVFIDPRTDEVFYRIRATSEPQATLARIARPYVRHLQQQFRRDSVAAMRHAVRDGSQRVT